VHTFSTSSLNTGLRPCSGSCLAGYGCLKPTEYGLDRLYSQGECDEKRHNGNTTAGNCDVLPTISVKMSFDSFVLKNG
jgi:hypothetical protein